MIYLFQCHYGCISFWGSKVCEEAGTAQNVIHLIGNVMESQPLSEVTNSLHKLLKDF